MRFLGFSAGLCAALFLAGCVSLPTVSQPGPAPELTPYATRILAHSGVSPAPVTRPAQASLASPAASSTPQIYKIARNDTLTSIARRFGVALDALLAANPGLGANSLQIGQSLNIPLASQGADAAAIATPAPLDISPGLCLPSGGGVYCYVPVHNPFPDALENISLQVSLLDKDGQSLASQMAFLPLNILQPGQVLPAGIFFKGVAGGVSARGQVLTAIRLSPGDPRYLQTAIQSLLVSTAWDGLSANVQGKVALAATGKPAARLWLAATAYDSSDQIVGSRRWEWNGMLKPGNAQPFSLVVYSLGPDIQRVEVLVEARP